MAISWTMACAAVLATKVKKTVHNRVEFVEVNDELWRDCRNGTLITIRQVCRMFDITTMTVYHWVRKLGLPKQVMNGGRNPPVRYDEGQLLAWGKAVGKSVVNPLHLLRVATATVALFNVRTTFYVLFATRNK